MGYPILLSRVRISKPPKTPPASNHQVLPLRLQWHFYPVFQNHGLWGHAYRKHRNGQSRQDIDERMRSWLPKSRVGATYQPRARGEFRDLKKPEWGWESRESSSPNFRNGRASDMDPWEAQRIHAQQRLEWIKKEIDADPCTALFGRRLKPLGFGMNLENSFMTLFRSFLEPNNGKNATNITKKSKSNSPDHINAHKRESEAPETPGPPVQDTKDPLFEFDPISGRMVPKSSKPLDVGEKQYTKGISPARPQTWARELQPSQTGYLSPVGGPGAKAKQTSFSKSITLEESLNSGGSPEIMTPEAAHKNESTPPSTAPPHEGGSGLPGASQVVSGDIRIPAGGSSATVRIRPSRPRGQGETSVKPTIGKGDGSTPQKHPPQKCGRHNTSKKLEGERDDQPIVIDQPGSLFKDEHSAPKEQEILKPIAPGYEDEDLSSLRAGDIRASYSGAKPPPTFEIRPHETSKYLKDSYFSSTGLVNDIHFDNLHQPAEKPCSIPNPECSSLARSLKQSKSSISADPQEQVPDGNKESGYFDERSSQACSQTSPLGSSTEVYRVLAYDPSSLQMTEAQTTSSLHTTTETLHPTEILPRLNNPARFLPYFKQMNADGYEIVSGGGDILVFKKSSQLVSHHESDGTKEIKHGSDEAAMQPTPSHLPKPDSIAPERPSNNSFENESLVKSATDPQRAGSRIKRIVRHMFIGGVATAATCYAIGVTSEYFRTGGQEGHGIDGFTEFESERRHRERT